MTGFWSVTDSRLPTTDRRSFLRWAHQVARSVGGSLDEVTLHASSFDAWELSSRDHELWLLCHRTHPYIAATSVEPTTDLEGCFVDLPLDVEAHGFMVLPASEMNRPLTDVDLADLAEAELHQVRYWRPKSPGELLFNHWD